VSSDQGIHPVIYPAVGSHANYFEPTDIPFVGIISPGPLRRLLRLIDEVSSDAEKAAAEAVPSDSPPTRSSDVRERPNGRGLIIGPARPPSRAHDQPHEGWHAVLLDRTESWVDFRGLWGFKGLLKDESGPPGPRWEREGHAVAAHLKDALADCDGCRLYWGNPHAWLDELQRLTGDQTVREMKAG
jgi:hypothetical protein